MEKVVCSASQLDHFLLFDELFEAYRAHLFAVLMLAWLLVLVVSFIGCSAKLTPPVREHLCQNIRCCAPRCVSVCLVTLSPRIVLNIILFRRSANPALLQRTHGNNDENEEHHGHKLDCKDNESHYQLRQEY